MLYATRGQLASAVPAMYYGVVVMKADAAGGREVGTVVVVIRMGKCSQAGLSLSKRDTPSAESFEEGGENSCVICGRSKFKV